MLQAPLFIVKKYPSMTIQSTLKHESIICDANSACPIIFQKECEVIRWIHHSKHMRL